MKANTNSICTSLLNGKIVINNGLWLVPCVSNSRVYKEDQIVKARCFKMFRCLALFSIIANHISVICSLSTSELIDLRKDYLSKVVAHICTHRLVFRFDPVPLYQAKACHVCLSDWYAHYKPTPSISIPTLILPCYFISYNSEFTTSSLLFLSIHFNVSLSQFNWVKPLNTSNTVPL